MERWGIKNENLFWSFGIFALVFIILLLAYAIYTLVYFLRKRFKKLKVVEDYLKKKLFFSASIRYMIEASLRLTHNSIFFLYLKGSFETKEDKLQTILNILLLVLIVLWPIFMTAFLLYFRDRLEKTSFKSKFHTMYLECKTDNYLGDKFKLDKAKCFLYHVPFCVRRLCLVLCFFLLLNKSFLHCFYGILVIYTCYIIYIIHVGPHIANFYNGLELFNEACIMLIVYSLTFFIATDTTPFLDVNLQWKLGYVTIGLVISVYAINFVIMTGVWIRNLIVYLKKRKAKKALKKAAKKAKVAEDAREASWKE